MFFVISKLIGFLVSPFWWIMIGLLAGWLIKRGKIRKFLYSFSLIVFMLFSNPLLFRWIAGSWEGELQPAESVRGKSDVCILLGGMSSYHEASGRIRFTQSTDRMMQVVDLYKKGIVNKILISGGTSRLIQKGKPESAYLIDYFVSIGIPESAILIDTLSRNTYENSLYSMALIQENHWNKRVVLVTSGFHMKRADMCFQKAGFTVEPYSADPLKSTSPLAFSDVFLPSIAVLQDWNYLLREWVGILMYWLAGYV